MASHADEKPNPQDERNPHSSRSKWRHQESSAYLKHAQPRPPTAEGSTAGLADFLNHDRVEPSGRPPTGGQSKDITEASGHAGETDVYDPLADGKEIICGPLLNYRHTLSGRWYGSVLVVAKGGGTNVLYQPSLELKRVGVRGAEAGAATGEPTRSQGQRLYSDKRTTFWAFDISAEIEQQEVEYEYSIPNVRFTNEKKPKVNRFFIHAANESMRVMFHSCNGFSVGTDEEAWSGAALWNDVNRKHAEIPFHVMVGGGDQIYNDGIRVHGPLRPWADIGNPRKRQEFPFSKKLRADCDDFYLKNYIRWYGTEPFCLANGQIPQLNIWDDHDVSLDGILLESCF